MEFPLQELIQGYPKAIAGICGAFVFLFVALLVGAWLIWGGAPRRRRAFNVARKLLQAADWEAALAQLKIVRAIGSPSASWQKTFDEFEAECLKHASKTALKDKRFEDALEQGMRAAQMLEEDETDVRANVQSAMLQEIRRLFSKTGETDAAMNLVIRTLQVQAPCREASFWQAMCEIPHGGAEAALTHLPSRADQPRGAFSLGGFPEPTAADARRPITIVDPPLYLGDSHKDRARRESLRFLTEANRMNANCPFIRHSSGRHRHRRRQHQHVVRARNSAPGPKGSASTPPRIRSARSGRCGESLVYPQACQRFPFSCPLFGGPQVSHSAGNRPRTRQFKLGNYADAAVLFDKVVKEGAIAPGLRDRALARQGGPI